MARKRYTPEQIIGKLRAIEVHLNSGMTSQQAANREEISVQSYFRWRKEYGGLKVDQAKRLKEMEKENARLGRSLRHLVNTVEDLAARRRFQGAVRAGGRHRHDDGGRKTGLWHLRQHGRVRA